MKIYREKTINIPCRWQISCVRFFFQLNLNIFHSSDSSRTLHPLPVTHYTYFVMVFNSYGNKLKNWQTNNNNIQMEMWIGIFSGFWFRIALSYCLQCKLFIIHPTKTALERLKLHPTHKKLNDKGKQFMRLSTSASASAYGLQIRDAESQEYIYLYISFMLVTFRLIN